MKGPGRHSTSSWGSAPAAQGPGVRRGPEPPKEPVWRPRVNQPTGFVAATRMRPTYFYGKRHSYAYYPQDWVDTDSGVSYQKGYYDENGQRYDFVTFEEGGRYKNVVCHCPYCEQDTILDLSAGDVESRSLKCPNCGGNMEIVSELDTILSDAGAAENTHEYDSEASLQNAFPEKKKKRVWPLVAAVVLALSIVRSVRDRFAETAAPSGGQLQQITYTENANTQNTTNTQNAVFLEKQADGSYHIVTDVLRSNKILYYDREYDSYYDEATDCWVWYNTDVEPAVWQYWYEGISSDFGDCGWMEHDDTGWYIEKSEGVWIQLPERYDSAGLWYID